MKLETTFGILAGSLVGSLLTIIIRNIFDYFKKYQEHRYQLKQRYFDKKIEVSLE